MAKNKLSLASRSLNYKLKIAFYLMSILPLLVCIYLVANYILPHTDLKWDANIVTLTTIILLSVVVSILGLLVVKEVFDRITSMTSEVRLIAAGDIGRRLKIEQDDEVDALGDALNQVTHRIRNNMEELKSYSEKTTEINLEIQERVVVLSSLLQISSLISQGAKLEDVLDLGMEKVRFLVKSDVVYLLLRDEKQDIFYVKASAGMDKEQSQKLTIRPKEDLFNFINTNKSLISDRDNALPEKVSASFYEKFRLKNTLALSVSLSGKVIAVLGIGNGKESFIYRKEEMELLDIFAKQITIAIENDILIHRLEKLEIKDTLTGLYNETFIRNRLQEEIKRAITYQRPCAFILLNIDNFKIFHQNFGQEQSDAILKKIAYLIRNSVTEIDRVGRINIDEFAILLPEKNKRRAQEIADDIRKKIEFSFSEEADSARKVTVSGGVSENPLDGIEAEELISKAKELANLAKKQGKNLILGFKETPLC